MLVRFGVENFLSFGEEVLFDMLANKSLTDDIGDKNVLNIKKDGLNRSILKNSMFYGANASGKSNLIKAIDFASDIVLKGLKTKRNIKDKQFKLYSDNSKRNNTKFLFIMLIEDNFYEYGFTFNSERIVEEWLVHHEINESHNNKDSERILFERLTNENNTTLIEIHEEFINGDKELEKKLNVYKESIGVEQRKDLFLTKLYQNNVVETKKFIDWFKKLEFVYPDTKTVLLEVFSHKNKDFTSFLGEFLKSVDTGIAGIKCIKQKFNFDESNLGSIEEYAKEELLQALDEIENRNALKFSYNDISYLIVKENDELSTLKMVTEHTTDESNKVHFEVSSESDGTRRLIDLVPIIYDLQDSNKIYFVDELDRSLHTMLSRHFLEYFIDNISTNGQLIVTTHDTKLLELVDDGIMRDDQIWFVNKYNNSLSKLISLDRIDRDRGISAEKAYLSGRLTGTPYIS